MTQKFKKYIAFQYDGYYPAGGLDDISGSFDDLEEAKLHAPHDRDGRRYEYAYVVDRDTWEIVWELG